MSQKRQLFSPIFLFLRQFPNLSSSYTDFGHKHIIVIESTYKNLSPIYYLNTHPSFRLFLRVIYYALKDQKICKICKEFPER